MTAEDVLKTPKWPEKWPFYEDDFKRMDETSDGDFYAQPRLVYHIGQLLALPGGGRNCDCFVLIIRSEDAVGVRAKMLKWVIL